MKKILTATPCSLNYIVEDTLTAHKSDSRIYVVTDSAFTMPPAVVSRKKAIFLPLIFYTRLQQAHLYQVDTSAIIENPNDFLKTGFTREANRNCAFRFTNLRDSADYILHLQIDSMSAQGIYHSTEEWFAVPYGVVSEYKASISDVGAFNRMSYILTDKNGRKILSNRYESRYLAETPNSDIAILTGYQYRMANGRIVEGLGETFHKNFHSIIKDLNELSATTGASHTFDQQTRK